MMDHLTHPLGLGAASPCCKRREDWIDNLDSFSH